MSTTSDSPFNPTERMLRQFAAMWIAFFLAIAARIYSHGQRPLLTIVVAVLALTIGPLGFMWPRFIRPVFVGWMRLAYPIGWVVSRVVLGAIFYGMFTPVAWAFRLTGRDLLGLKSQPSVLTYWQAKPTATDKSQYLRQF